MSAIPEFTVHARPESVARWTIGRDGHAAPPPPPNAPLPLAYFVFLRVQPMLGVSIHRLLGRDPDRGLYGGVSYRAARPPRVGEAFLASGEVTATRPVATARGELTLRTLAMRYRTADGVVVEEDVRMVDLPPGPPQPPARGPARAPSAPKIADLAPITRTQIAWLTVESGDMNALHLDARYAAGRQYPDVVVPGTLTVALLERELARALGRPLRALDLRLQAACYPDEPLALHAAARDSGLAFELYAGGELRAEGTAA
jgi:hydroxyacyl-ACP dehydratase HTD2-like protein with hotdog domain